MFAFLASADDREKRHRELRGTPQRREATNGNLFFLGEVQGFRVTSTAWHSCLEKTLLLSCSQGGGIEGGVQADAPTQNTQAETQTRIRTHTDTDTGTDTDRHADTNQEQTHTHT